MGSGAKTVEDHVADNVRLLRKAQGISQTEFAQHLCELGLSWSQNTVAFFENREGPRKRGLAVTELIAIAKALMVNIQEITRLPTETESLLLGTRTWSIEHPELGPLHGAQLSLRGDRNPSDGDPPNWGELLKSADEFGNDIRIWLRRWGRDDAENEELFYSTLEKIGREERMAARRIDGSREALYFEADLVQASVLLWGKSLAEERELREGLDRRFDHSTASENRALRGHITRQLYNELAQAIRSADERLERSQDK